MARYLIGTALTLKGTVKKNQPADKFRKLLIRQKIPFTERELPPMHDRIDLELKDPRWNGLSYKPGGLISALCEHPATEFTFENEGAL